MKKTVTSRYDVAEHLRTPEEMAAYLKRAWRRQMVTPHSLQKLLVTSPERKACHK